MIGIVYINKHELFNDWLNKVSQEYNAFGTVYLVSNLLAQHLKTNCLQNMSFKIR